MKFCWVTISVKNIEKSVAFYRDILGLPENRRIQANPDLEIVFLGSGETQVELIWNRNNTDIHFGKDISMGFEVDSLEKITELLKSKQIEIHAGPFQPNLTIRFMYVLDPDGVKIQFVENLNSH